jgi:hypothetical protein
MAEFDQKKAYAQQEEVFFDDGRELELLHFVYGKSDLEEIRGNPQKVLAAIDEFARTKKYLMNVGEDKGKIVTNLISEVKPETMVLSTEYRSRDRWKTYRIRRSSWEATLVTPAFFTLTPSARREASVTSVLRETLSLVQSLPRWLIWLV